MKYKASHKQCGAFLYFNHRPNRCLGSTPERKEQKHVNDQRAHAICGFYPHISQSLGRHKNRHGHTCLTERLPAVYPLLSYELLAENIRAIFLSGGAELEELVMGVEFGGMFTVYDEASRMAILASIDFNQTVGVNEVFVNTIYVREFHEPVYCERETKLRCKVNTDGSVTENPPELVLKSPK